MPKNSRITREQKFIGLNTRDPAHRLRPGELVEAQGVSFNARGDLAKRLGSRLKVSISGQIIIDDCDSTGSWSVSNDFLLALSTDPNDKVQGASALKALVPFPVVEAFDEGTWISGDQTRFAPSYDGSMKREGANSLKISVASNFELDQSQLLQAGLLEVYGDYWAAQTFTAGFTGQMKRVSLLMERVGTPQNLIVEIRTVSGGFPTSTILASASIPAASVPESPNYGWVDVTFSAPIDVTIGTQYAIVLHAGGDLNNNYKARENPNNPYPGGARRASTNGGSTWTTTELFDLAFKTYRYYPNYHVDKDLGATSTKNLKGVTKLKMDVRATFSGTIRFQFGEAAATEQTFTLTVFSNVWTTAEMDISGIPDGSKDAVRYLRISATGDFEQAETIWVDNLHVGEVLRPTIDRDFGTNLVDLSGVNSISLWVKPTHSIALKLGMGEASHDEQTAEFAAYEGNWQKLTWNLSLIPATSRDAIKYFRVTITDPLNSSNGAFTLLIDNIAKPSDTTPIHSGVRYHRADGSKYTVVGLGDSLYRLDEAFSPTLISSGFASGKRFSFTRFNDFLILTNGVQPVKKWDGTTLSDAVDANFYAKCVLAYKNHLFFVENNSVLLKWLPLGSLSAWQSTDWIKCLDDGDPILAIAAIGFDADAAAQEALLVYKGRSIQIVYGSLFSSTSQDDIQREGLFFDHGLLAPHSLVHYGAGHVYIAQEADGDITVRYTDGRESHIISGHITPTLKAINKAAADKISGWVHGKDYILTYPDGGSSVNDKTLRCKLDKLMNPQDPDTPQDRAWLGPDPIGYACFIGYDAPGDTGLLYASDPARDSLLQIEVPGAYDDDGNPIKMSVRTGMISLSGTETPDVINRIFIQKDNPTINPNALNVKLRFDGDPVGTDFGPIDDKLPQNEIIASAAGRGYLHDLEFTNYSIFGYTIKGWAYEYTPKKTKPPNTYSSA